MRINKYIASCGICSRRAAEQLIIDGKVKVNNKVIVNLATDIDVYNDTVAVEGRKVVPVTHNIYIMFHKPKGCVCTMKDEEGKEGRKTIVSYLTDFEDKRLFPIGRLDYDTEGLLLLTNDGNLTNVLTKPENEIPKTYIAKVEGELSQNDLGNLRSGAVIDGIKLKRCKIKLLDFENNISRFEVTITEGKNRQIHKMFETVGKELVFLKRVQIGELKLGGLGRGAYRYLTNKEVDSLLKF